MSRWNYPDHMKRSFAFCGETCPDVDRKFSEAVVDIQRLVPDVLHDDLEKIMAKLCESVKDVGTEKLRSALDDACYELIEAENKIANLEAA